MAIAQKPRRWVMSKVKSINSLMAYLRDKHGIRIGGSIQKRKLRNIGYYHGYKGYRYIARPHNRIMFMTSMK